MRYTSNFVFQKLKALYGVLMFGFTHAIYGLKTHSRPSTINLYTMFAAGFFKRLETISGVTQVSCLRE